MTRRTGDLMAGPAGGSRGHKELFAAAALLLLTGTPSWMTASVAAAEQVKQAGVISVDVDKAMTIAKDEPAVTVFIANADIADVQANDPTRIVVYGKKPGSTSLYVTTRSGQVRAYTVNVVRGADQIQDALRATNPGAGVKVESASNGLTVTGQVATPREAEALKAAAQQYLQEKDGLNFNVAVTGGTQINLQVRIAEVSRSVSRSFGFNWSAVFNNGSVAVGLLTGRNPVTGGFGDFARDTSLNGLSSLGFGYHSDSTNISALVDALQNDGLVTILAEPNLTATSGETASFLAGGEFPIPVAQSRDQVTIEWKHFGVSLDFTPTVLAAGRISVKVRPEVSELSDKGAVTINNVKVPSIAVRRAETTVELASGQSFAIAGLFQNSASSNVKRFPWLGDIPILGALFRSTSFTRNESELVIIVTPYVVRPVSHTADLRLPTDNLVFANQLEQILYGRIDHAGAPPAGERPHLAGPAGFMLEEKP
ncbi:type II and III secretion system protein family protein [Sphingobium nicotianae]|uniref:Type II and III secretion system protein family protein n=1 Tax=Sphingobium nicotianae TaxID=2782607 RepID=A0A9X1DFU2_9SPHN|nr:type II and III secretion system protein family protein [Sphingobium nicotianae]MBT2189081.1 type II and III secretion system protein family protein [Sphingobium nicotianae]